MPLDTPFDDKWTKSPFGVPEEAEIAALSPTHRYWRFEMGTGYSDSHASWQELEFHDATGDIAGTATITSSASTYLGGGVGALVDDDLTTNAGLCNFTNSGSRRIIDFDFGSVKTLEHLRLHDRGDSSGSLAESHTSRIVGVYFSDNGSDYTLFFVGYFTPASGAGWHTINAPAAAGVYASGANLWAGVYMSSVEDTANDGNFTIREMVYYEGAAPRISNGVAPVSNIQGSRHSGSLDVAEVFSGDAGRWNSFISKAPRGELLAHEMATATKIDRVDITSTEFPASSPEDFALVVGDGTTFVPVFSITGQTGWSSGETRSFDGSLTDQI